MKEAKGKQCYVWRNPGHHFRLSPQFIHSYWSDICEACYLNKTFVLSLTLATKLEGNTPSSKNQGKTNADFLFLLLSPVTAYTVQNTHEGRYFATCIKPLKVDAQASVKVVIGCVHKPSMCKTGLTFGSKYTLSLPSLSLWMASPHNLTIPYRY